MINLENEQRCLLELIKASLFNLNPEIPVETNWDLLFKLSKAQCVVPLVTSFVPQVYRNDWFIMSCHSKAFYMQLLHEQESLIRLFKTNNIPIIIFKGIAAAVYYPVPSLRTYGDVDFYLSEEYLESARYLLEHNGFKFVRNDEREYIYNKNGIIFELHSKFSSKHYNNIEHYIITGLNNPFEYKVNNFTFPGLPTYENGIVLLGHIMQHLKASGIGLRQIIDWMMFVHEELNDSAWNNRFCHIAREAGLENLAIVVTFMCRKWLGLPNEITWCNTADEEVADQLLMRILIEGNFGCDSSFNDSFRRNVSNMGLFTYLNCSGIDNWRLAQKYVIFRPFAWLYQICRYIGKGIAALFKRNNNVISDKRLMSLEDLLKKIE